MKNLLVAVIVGLLGAVHSTPVSTATFTSAEHDVLQEAMVDELLIPSVITQTPKSKASSQPTQQPNSNSERRHVNGSSNNHHTGDEESGSGVLEEKLESITEAKYTESGSGVFEEKMESSIEAKTATYTESGSGMFEDKAEPTTAAETTTDTGSSNELPSTQSSNGKSGRRVKLDHDPPTISSTTSSPAASTAFPVLGPGEVGEKVLLPKSETGLYQENPPVGKEPTRDAGHVKTPGWIVILTCIVAVAVLVIVCVAVVTRERWHGPHQALQPQITTGQEREREMETFLHHDQPKEKGSLDEYTVVPLEELPQSYSTH